MATVEVIVNSALSDGHEDWHIDVVSVRFRRGALKLKFYNGSSVTYRKVIKFEVHNTNDAEFAATGVQSADFEKARSMWTRWMTGLK